MTSHKKHNFERDIIVRQRPAKGILIALRLQNVYASQNP